VRLEQASIQERYRPKRRSCAAPLFLRLVERSEEERSQKVAMDSPPPPQAAIHFLCQKALSAAEPTFGLDEVQEQHSGEMQQRQAVPVVGLHGPWKRSGHPIQGGAKFPEKAPANCLGTERVGRLCRKCEISALTAPSQSRNRSEALTAWTIEVQLENRVITEPNSHCDPAAGAVEGEH
jgi:hypothetical protein